MNNDLGVKMEHVRRMALNEVASWPIEAKEERNSDYFYHFSDVLSIENGQKNYIIGRKGTGKTAIAEYLHGGQSYRKFSRLLSFKNFPFAALYKFADSSYSRPNQYITIWTYVIYNYICSMMADNERVLSKCSFDLRKAFEFEVKGALAQSVKNITSRSFGLNVLGTGGNYSQAQGDEAFDFVRANESLKSFIQSHIDDSDYYVIFDELDEDYRDVLNPDRKDGYFELLISLFKAVQNIRAEFSGSTAKIRPLIFLRDDIFELCRDNDKNKWLDRAVVLKWDENQLRHLTKFRLSKALKIAGATVSPDDAWDELFRLGKIRIGTSGSNEIEPFKFMSSKTFLRPRDIVSYLRECAKIAITREGDLRIGSQVIKAAIKEHSAYMRREIIDEIFPVMEDISEVLDVLSKIRKQIFSRKEFNDRYREYQNQLAESEKSKISESQVLKILFHFNVIGNLASGGNRIFGYNSQVKVLNMDENFCVHGGLLLSLNIA